MEQKITIVLLPGLNGTEGLFKPLIECAPENFDVIVIPYPEYTLLSYPDLKNFVLDRLRSIHSPYIVVGESFSGPIALMVGESHPANLIGIVLVSTFVQAPNLKIGKYLPWKLGFKLVGPLYALRGALSRTKNKGFIIAISNELKRVSPVVLADRIRSIFETNAIRSLQQCRVPIVYFRGIKDFVVPQKNLELIKRIKPDIGISYFDTQHFLLQDKPQEAWHEISRFVEKILPNIPKLRASAAAETSFR